MRQSRRTTQLLLNRGALYSDVPSIRVRVPGFEPGISPPQGEVLTTILHTPGEAGYRSLYLSHAKRALYHLSYIPGCHNHADTHNTYSLRTTHSSPRSMPHTARITLLSVSSLHIACLRIHKQSLNHSIKYKTLYVAFLLITSRRLYSLSQLVCTTCRRAGFQRLSEK